MFLIFLGADQNGDPRFEKIVASLAPN